MRIRDWSSDVCSSDLAGEHRRDGHQERVIRDPGFVVRKNANPALRETPATNHESRITESRPRPRVDRKRVVKGKSASVRVHLGGRRTSTTKLHTKSSHNSHLQA